MSRSHGRNRNLRDLVPATVLTAAVLFAWPRDDPFFSTAVVLPLLIWTAAWLARRLGARIPDWQRAALAGLTVTLPLRPRLGWPQADVLWAAALLVLLAAFLLRLLPGLRRRLSGATQNPDIAFFLLPLLVYGAVLPWALEHRQPDGDEPYYLLLSHSLVQDLDVDLGNNYRSEDWRRFMDRPVKRQPGDPRGENGEIFSRHNAFLPAVVAPFYAVGGRHGVAFFMALASAALAWITLRMALRRWPEHPSGSLCAWAVLAFTPPLLVFSHQVWVEVPAALLLALAFDRLQAMRQRIENPEDAGIPVSLLLQLGLICALLPLLKMRFLLVAAPLALLALWPLRRRWKALAGLAAGLGAAVLAMLAFNVKRYGNALKMYRTNEWELFLSPPVDYLRGGLGMFYDCAFGLFAVAPLWMLLLPAVAQLARRRDRFLGPLLWISLPYLLTLAPRLEWYGGWSPAFRYPLVLLPLGSLALVPLLDRRGPGLRIAFTVLGSITALLTFLWVLVPGWTYHLADGGNHLLHRLGWMLQGDFARLFPSTVRPRWTVTAIWVFASLLLIPLAGRRAGRGRAGRWRAGRGRAGRWRADRWRTGRVDPATLGLWAVLVVMIALPLLAQQLPTTVIHGEDGWVAKRGGRLEPERWIQARPSKVGAWMIPHRGELRAGVVPGGERVRIRVVARRENLGPETIHVLAGDRPLAVLPVKKFVFWEFLETEPVDWPAGEPLVLRCPQTGNPDHGVMVDRVELLWL